MMNKSSNQPSNTLIAASESPYRPIPLPLPVSSFADALPLPLPLPSNHVGHFDHHRHHSSSYGLPHHYPAMNKLDSQKVKKHKKKKSCQSVKRPSEESMSDSSTEEEKGNISIGRWTREEHEQFEIGLAKFQDRQWKHIASLIPTRTVVQVRTHAQKHFQKMERVAGKKNTPGTQMHHHHGKKEPLMDSARSSKRRSMSVGNNEQHRYALSFPRKVRHKRTASASDVSLHDQMHDQLIKEESFFLSNAAPLQPEVSEVMLRAVPMGMLEKELTPYEPGFNQLMLPTTHDTTHPPPLKELAVTEEVRPDDMPQLFGDVDFLCLSSPSINVDNITQDAPDETFEWFSNETVHAPQSYYEETSHHSAPTTQHHHPHDAIQSSSDTSSPSLTNTLLNMVPCVSPTEMSSFDLFFPDEAASLYPVKPMMTLVLDDPKLFVTEFFNNKQTLETTVLPAL